MRKFRLSHRLQRPDTCTPVVNIDSREYCTPRVCVSIPTHVDLLAIPRLSLFPFLASFPSWGDSRYAPQARNRVARKWTNGVEGSREL